jgi:hypothetical protein
MESLRVTYVAGGGLNWVLSLVGTQEYQQWHHGTMISQCHNLIFYAKIDDRGGHWGNMVQILA